MFSVIMVSIISISTLMTIMGYYYKDFFFHYVGKMVKTNGDYQTLQMMFNFDVEFGNN